MPPKVEAVLLSLALVGAWIVLENSRRIDLTQSDEEPGRWAAVTACQPMPAGSRYSAGSALAADGDATATSPVASDEVCATGYRDFSATARGAPGLP